MNEKKAKRLRAASRAGVAHPVEREYRKTTPGRLAKSSTHIVIPKGFRRDRFARLWSVGAGPWFEELKAMCLHRVYTLELTSECIRGRYQIWKREIKKAEREEGRLGNG